MDLNWSRLAERRMLAAVAEGKLDHLPGEGKPLPDAPSTAFVDPTEAIGMRIMAEAGFVPKELRLRARLADLRKAYAAETDPDVRYLLMTMIADVSMNEAIARECRLHLLHGTH